MKDHQLTCVFISDLSSLLPHLCCSFFFSLWRLVFEFILLVRFAVPVLLILKQHLRCDGARSPFLSTPYQILQRQVLQGRKIKPARINYRKGHFQKGDACAYRHGLECVNYKTPASCRFGDRCICPLKWKAADDKR